MLPTNSLLQNRYLIVRLLGHGGMGAVYEARDQRLGGRVALKQMTVAGERLERAFENEARLLSQLRHAALPVVIDYFTEQTGRYLVMQYIPGEDVAELVARRGRAFPVETVLDWGVQLLGVLEYLHGRTPPILHRDIKPQNIKVTPEGQLVLLDFGLSKGTAAEMSRLGGGSSVPGYTPAFAPFEQVRGTGTDERSDLYSASATLYFLLTNALPPDALERAGAAVAGAPDPLRWPNELEPHIPPAVAAVLMAALAQRPDERPRSAAEMRAAFRGARATGVFAPTWQGHQTVGYEEIAERWRTRDARPESTERSRVVTTSTSEGRPTSPETGRPRGQGRGVPTTLVVVLALALIGVGLAGALGIGVYMLGFAPWKSEPVSGPGPPANANTEAPVDERDDQGGVIDPSPPAAVSLPPMDADVAVAPMPDEHKWVASDWLHHKVYYRLATLKDLAAGDGLASRRQDDPNYYPYYRRGDFNFDGRQDFAIVLVDRRESKDKFALAIFHGPFPDRMTPASEAKLFAGLDLSSGGLFGFKATNDDGTGLRPGTHLASGVFQSDVITVYVWRNGGYVEVDPFEGMPGP